jgi:hypothetical protein
MGILLDGNGNTYALAIAWCFSITSFINVFAGIILLLLIRYMLTTGRIKMNMYVWMVTWMMINQILCDATLIFYVFTTVQMNVEWSGRFMHACIGFWGSGVAVWNTSIVFMVWYTTLQKRKSIDETKALYCIGLLSFTTAIGMGTAMASNTIDLPNIFQSYEILRLFFSFSAMCFIGLLLDKLRKTTTPATRTKSPLHKLLRKLIWYPLGTVALRVCSIPYNFVYHVNLYALPQALDFSLKLTLWTNAILIPSQALIDLIIFVNVRNASVPLMEMLYLRKIDIPSTSEEVSNDSSQLAAAHARRIRAPSQNEGNCVVEKEHAEYYQERLDSMDENELIEELSRDRSLGVEITNPMSRR